MLTGLPFERFDGKTVLVTGAGSGIGAAVARMFGAAGAAVIVNDHGNMDLAEQVGKQIATAGGRSLVIDADVGNSQAVDELFEAATGELGDVDVLVNNAGITTYHRLVDMPEDDWDRVLRVNLKGTFLCCKAVAPRMIDRRSGKIVNISSDMALIGGVELTHYCASKGGVVSMTKALARELAEYRINVNAIAPGPTDTPMWKLRSPERKATVTASMPFGVLATADDVAHSALFLASDRAKAYTGWVFSPNGGTVM